MCISDLYSKRGSLFFCMTIFCSEDDARVENLHSGQSVTSLSILFCSLISTLHKRLRAKGQGRTTRKVSDFPHSYNL